MVREFSAGGVVLRKMRGQWFVAVIEPRMERSRKKAVPARGLGKSAKASIIALPKGTIDGDEKPEQTALREVTEETGVEACPVAKLKDIKYYYVRNWGDHARVFKIVSFYLFLYRSGRLGAISPEMRIEVLKAFWLPIASASKALSYAGEREVVASAMAYLENHPELGANASNAAR